MKTGLPFKLFDYLLLVDWTGRCVRDNKRGAILADIKPLFERLGINGEAGCLLLNLLIVILLVLQVIKAT